MDESQLLNIKIKPSSNSSRPRLKPGTVNSVSFDSFTDMRKSTKIPEHPIEKLIDRTKKKKTSKNKQIMIPQDDWEELTSKKRRFTTSLMKWRNCLVTDNKKDTPGEQKRLSLPATLPEPELHEQQEDTKRTFNKNIQCELGLEMHRYVCDTEKKTPLKSVEDNGRSDDEHNHVKTEDSSEDSSGTSDNENENSSLIDESNFAAWGSLLLLFRICNACSQEVTNVQHGVKGRKIFVKSVCVCGNRVTWTSRPP